MVQAGHDILVGEAEDEESSAGKDLIASLIVPTLVIVDAAIDFDDKVRGVAVEINDEAIYRLLTAEAEASKASAS